MIKWILVLFLLVVYHTLPYAWEVFPLELRIKPFPFMVYDGEFTNGIRAVTYIHEVSGLIRHILISIVVLLIIQKATILRELGIISLIICIFDLIWYVVFYNNPFSTPEIAVKLFVLLTTLIAIVYLYDGTTNSNSDG